MELITYELRLELSLLPDFAVARCPTLGLTSTECLTREYVRGALRLLELTLPLRVVLPDIVLLRGWLMLLLWRPVLDRLVLPALLCLGDLAGLDRT